MGNPEERFSRVAAQSELAPFFSFCFSIHLKTHISIVNNKFRPPNLNLVVDGSKRKGDSETIPSYGTLS